MYVDADAEIARRLQRKISKKEGESEAEGEVEVEVEIAKSTSHSRHVEEISKAGLLPRNANK